MNNVKEAERIDEHRRRLFGAGALTLAAAQLGPVGRAVAQSGDAEPAAPPALTPGTNNSSEILRVDGGQSAGQ